jgi:hypothetical protein
VEKLNRAVSQLHRTRWDDFRQRRAQSISNYIDIKQKQRIVKIIIGHIRFKDFLHAMLDNIKVANEKKKRKIKILFAVIRMFLQVRKLYLKFSPEGGLKGLHCKLKNQMRYAFMFYVMSNDQVVRCDIKKAKQRRLNFTNLFPRLAIMPNRESVDPLRKLSLLDQLGQHLKKHKLNGGFRT